VSLNTLRVSREVSTLREHARSLEVELEDANAAIQRREAATMHASRAQRVHDWISRQIPPPTDWVRAFAAMQTGEDATLRFTRFTLDQPAGQTARMLTVQGEFGAKTGVVAAGKDKTALAFEQYVRSLARRSWIAHVRDAKLASASTPTAPRAFEIAAEISGGDMQTVAEPEEQP
jgi:hypothetical protein